MTISREFKFRAWDKDERKMISNVQRAYDCTLMYDGTEDYVGETNFNEMLQDDKYIIMQYTGLKDKNGEGSCIYEKDFVDLQGNVKGNLYETPELHKDPTYLLIQGFGTKDWLSTYKKAVERGCNDAK